MARLRGAHEAGLEEENKRLQANAEAALETVEAAVAQAKLAWEQAAALSTRCGELEGRPGGGLPRLTLIILPTHSAPPAHLA